jgi:hypothetical protein
VGRVDPTHTRNWNPAAWATYFSWAAQHFDADIVFGGTPEEYETTEHVRKLMGAPAARSFNITRCGADLDTLLGVLTLSQAYVGHDTGPMHLAAALGKPVIAVFSGGHWPRFVPHAVSGRILTVAVPCRGCCWECHLPAPYCISLVSPEMLIMATRDMRLDASDGFEIRSIDLRDAAVPDTPVALIEASLPARMRDSAVATSHTSSSPGNNLAPTAGAGDFPADRRWQDNFFGTDIQTLEHSRDQARAELQHRVDEVAALEREKSEWLNRNADLSEAIARLTVECQALRSHGELERYRHHVELVDGQKRLSLAGDQIASLHARLRELLAERALIEASLETQAKVPLATLERLEAQLKDVEAERNRLRDDMAGSLALRMARSLAWILSPLRKTIVGARTRDGQ